METKVGCAQSFLSSVGFPLSFEVPTEGLSGSMIFAWRLGVAFDRVLVQRNIISILVRDDPSTQVWNLSFIHCPADWSLKDDFWLALSDLGASSVDPWVVMGDFNTVLHCSEKIGGLPVASSSCNGLYNLILDFSLVDLGFVGPLFTWCNSRKGNRQIKGRIDKGYATSAWTTLLPKALISHLPRTTSDHCPIFLQTVGGSFTGSKPFIFEQFWFQELGCKSTVKRAWAECFHGSSAFQLV